ncbi:MAG: type II toxin-antitoxin system Phd/YefM family antitoxin [Treponema sp.]|nr:type II toxin-antitoxin system Phd/YefM family antitoxin [Treponema sp.]
MLVETKQMVPITRLQKQLTQTIRNLSDSGEAVYILKNNNMEAVLLSYQEYEYLKEIEEIFEHFEIKNMVDTRLKNYNPQKNISWDKIRENK